jgi:predicted amidophosphoribosyltransferase
MVDHLDFYTEKKYCPRCHDYVPYLASLTRSFCAMCGQPVNLFSKEDWQKFRRRDAKTANAKKTSFLSQGNKPRHTRPSADNN